MEIQFEKLDLVADTPILVEWLSSEEWPYHGNSRLSPDKVRSMIDEGLFHGSNHETFWIMSGGARVGLIRLFDLDDIDDGNPLFDLRLRAGFRGMGIGRQAVTWLTHYMFEKWPGLTRIEGNTRSDNVAMKRVFLRCLFAKEAHKRNAWRCADGRFFDSIHYGITREDWRNGRVTPPRWDEIL